MAEPARKKFGVRDTMQSHLYDSSCLEAMDLYKKRPPPPHPPSARNKARIVIPIVKVHYLLSHLQESKPSLHLFKSKISPFKRLKVAQTQRPCLFGLSEHGIY